MELRTYLRVLLKYWWLVLITLLVTLGFTAWFTFRQVPIFESSASFIVRPTLSAEDAKGELSGLDVLGRQGDIASTFAEMASSRQIKARAAENLGLSSSEKSSLSVDTQLVSGTYLLKITVEGYDPELARDFATMVGAETIRFVEELYVTYELVPLDSATASSLPSKPDTVLNLVLGAALGLVLGGVLAFLAHYLQSPLEAATTPVVPAAVPDSQAMAAGAPAAQPVPEVVPDSQPVLEPASTAVPAAAMAIASDTEEQVQAVEDTTKVQEGMATGESAGLLGIPFASRRLVGWIAAAVLTVVLIVGASAVWLSGRGTSAALVPAETAAASLAPTAAWTATAMGRPTNRAMPAAALNSTPTMEPSVIPTREPSATPTREPSATPTREPSATPTREPSAIPTREPSATPTREPSATPSPEPSATPTARSTATTVPSRTPTDAPSPTSGPTESSSPPATPTATGTLLPSPRLLTPLDRQDFQPDSEIVLTWEPVGELAPDAYYVLTVAYSHRGDTWFDDVPWTRDTSWTLSEHDYLLDLSDDGQFWWSVQVVGQTGTDASGKPIGEPLSSQSAERLLTWRRTSGGGGGASTPQPPPP